MMLTSRLVRLVESHSEALAAGLLEKIQHSRLTPDYHKVPPEELKHRTIEIYGQLGEWLAGKDEREIERHYTVMGARRAQQHVPLSQVTWAIVLTRDNLWEFLKKEGVPVHANEIFSELELLNLLEQFFDRAIYYAAVGYERVLNTGTSHGLAKAG